MTLDARAWLRALAGLLPGTLVLTWALFVLGKPLPEGLSRALAGATLVCLLLYALITLRRALAAGPERRRSALALLALLALGMALSWVGLDYGVVDRYNRDEGVYRKYASEINAGKPFPTNFIYPHLSFYVDAFAIWLASLFVPGIVSLVESLWDVTGWSHTVRMVLRGVTALYGGLVVWPVFRIAERLRGLGAACLAGALMALSPLWCWGSHNSTNDVPAAFFVTLCLMYLTRLLDEDRFGPGGDKLRPWLLAGLASGLAAGSKYPAGLVAVAIVAVWLRLSLRRRRPSPSLLWACLVSLGAFLASMPALLLHLDQALHGGTYSRLTAGFEIYKGEGWLGVTEPSNLLYYLSLLAQNFGLPALLVGLLGLLFAGGKTLERVAWLLPFPVAWLALVCSMTIVVGRNIYPLIPLTAALVGTGISAAIGILCSRWPRRSRATAGLVAVACLALPLTNTFTQAVRLTRPDTRALARDWIMENVPWGATILKETFTPEFPPGTFGVGRLGRHAIQQSFDYIAHPDHELLLLSSHSYARFFREDLDYPNIEADRASYQRLFDSFPVLRDFDHAWHTEGPSLTLRRVIPPSIEYLRARSFRASDVFLASKSMRDDQGFSYRHPHHWSAFKAFLEPGRYRLSLEGRLQGPGWLEVLDFSKVQLGRYDLDADGTAMLELPRRDKYLFYLRLAPGSFVGNLKLEAIP